MRKYNDISNRNHKVQRSEEFSAILAVPDVWAKSCGITLKIRSKRLICQQGVDIYFVLRLRLSNCWNHGEIQMVLRWHFRHILIFQWTSFHKQAKRSPTSQKNSLHNNVPSDSMKNTQEYLDKTCFKDTHSMKWPALPPDFNLIWKRAEHTEEGDLYWRTTIHQQIWILLSGFSGHIKK